LYTVYEAWEGEEDEGSPKSLSIGRETMDQYNKGLQLYTMGQWETAIPYFIKARECAEKSGKEDYLCDLYLSRIVELKANPPGSDWEAVITMTEK